MLFIDLVIHPPIHQEIVYPRPQETEMPLSKKDRAT